MLAIDLISCWTGSFAGTALPFNLLLDPWDTIDAIFDATLNAFAENSQQKSSITEGTRSDYQAPLLGDYSTR